MAQDFFYPPGSSNVTTIASIGPNSGPIPASSDLIGGKSPTSTLLPINVDALGNLIVTPLAGSVNDVNLIKVSGVAITLGQKVMAASMPVTFASDQSILSVSVSNFPATTAVTQSTSPWVVSGSVAVTNFPATQPVSGAVAVSNFPATQPVSGTVAVTQSTSPWVVSGTGTFLVNGSGFTQPVSGTFFQATQPVSGTVAVSNFPVTQPVSGTVAVTQSTSPWVVSGTVSSNSTPITTSGTITQAAVTVGITAVRCTVSGAAPNAARKALIVEPDPASTAKFFIGSSSVASSGASRGIPLVAGAQFIANFDASDFYIISDTAAQTFFVVEEV